VWCACGLPDGEHPPTFASGLADRFRARFWVCDRQGSCPAMALHGSGRPSTPSRATWVTCRPPASSPQTRPPPSPPGSQPWTCPTPTDCEPTPGV